MYESVLALIPHLQASSVDPQQKGTVAGAGHMHIQEQTKVCKHVSAQFAVTTVVQNTHNGQVFPRHSV